MFKLIVICVIFAVYGVHYSDCIPVYQILPPREGYIPVYIRFGDTPLEDINPELALAFHEGGIRSRQIKISDQMPAELESIDSTEDDDKPNPQSNDISNDEKNVPSTVVSSDAITKLKPVAPPTKEKSSEEKSSEENIKENTAHEVSSEEESTSSSTEEVLVNETDSNETSKRKTRSLSSESIESSEGALSSEESKEHKQHVEEPAKPAVAVDIAHSTV